MKTSIFPPALVLFGPHPALTEVGESSAADSFGARLEPLSAVSIPLQQARLWKCWSHRENAAIIKLVLRSP